jgi:hypothetical protein
MDPGAWHEHRFNCYNLPSSQIEWPAGPAWALHVELPDLVSDKIRRAAIWATGCDSEADLVRLGPTPPFFMKAGEPN